MFFAKDFIETAEGLIFAVVSQEIEQDKVLCFLRYVSYPDGWRKVNTEVANDFLKLDHPHYLHHSPILDAHLHAVAQPRIIKHHRPKQRLQQLLNADNHDAVEQDLLSLANLFQQNGLNLADIGITGSLLIGVQQHGSDIDVVCYGRNVFQRCRAITEKLIGLGRLQNLTEQDWMESYQRRDCALSFDEYVWHEQRKTNKAIINGRKFDLNFIDDHAVVESEVYQKIGSINLHCKIVDDTYGFDYPAVFKIDHEYIDSIVCFTATYTGQALRGETVQVSGVLEQTTQGLKRIVVGSSREAQGEYIKVVSCLN
jgi:predicted nucleotidyltransferase